MPTSYNPPNDTQMCVFKLPKDTFTYNRLEIITYARIAYMSELTRRVRKRSILFWETGFFIVLAQIKQVSGVGGLASLAIEDYILQV